jgi:hypothetical protein
MFCQIRKRQQEQRRFFLVKEKIIDKPVKIKSRKSEKKYVRQKED